MPQILCQLHAAEQLERERCSATVSSSPSRAVCLGRQAVGIKFPELIDAVAPAISANPLPIVLPKTLSDFPEQVEPAIANFSNPIPRKGTETQVVCPGIDSNVVIFPNHSPVPLTVIFPRQKTNHFVIK